MPSVTVVEASTGQPKPINYIDSVLPGPGVVTTLRVTSLGLGIAHVSALGNFTSSLVTNDDVASGAGILPSKLGQMSAVAGQVLAWSGTQWQPSTETVTPANIAQGGAQAGQLMGWDGADWGPLSTFGDPTLSNIQVGPGNTSLVYSAPTGRLHSFNHNGTPTVQIARAANQDYVDVSPSAVDGIRFLFDRAGRAAYYSVGFAAATGANGADVNFQAQVADTAGFHGSNWLMLAGRGSGGADGGSMTIEAGIVTGGGRGGLMRIAGGDSDGIPGSLEMLGGNGVTYATGWGFLGFGNMAIGQGATGWALSDWHGMVRGVFVHNADVAPTSDPGVTGGFMWWDAGLPNFRTATAKPAFSVLQLDATGKIGAWNGTPTFGKTTVSTANTSTATDVLTVASSGGGGGIARLGFDVGGVVGSIYASATAAWSINSEQITWRDYSATTAFAAFFHGKWRLGDGSTPTEQLEVLGKVMMINGGVTLRLEATSSATANAGAAVLPATPLGFLVGDLTGTAIKIPYYAN